MLKTHVILRVVLLADPGGAGRLRLLGFGRRFDALGFKDALFQLGALGLTVLVQLDVLLRDDARRHGDQRQHKQRPQHLD